MKNKFIFNLFAIVLWVSTVQVFAQKIDVKEKVKTASTNRVDDKINQSVNKGLNKIEEGIGGLFKKKEKNKSENEQKSSGADTKQSKSVGKNGGDTKNDETSFATYQKFDFIPGDKILAFDDFKQDEIGDLPAKWNSTGGAEIVKLNGFTNNWVQLSGAEAYFSPQYISKMPDNCTIDFDMVVTHNNESGWYQRFFIEILSSATLAGTSQHAYMSPNTGISFEIEPKIGEMKALSYQKGETITSSKSQYVKLKTKNIIHVSIMRQLQRVKIYLDEKKVFDLLQGLAISPNYYFRFGSFVQDEGDAETTKMYVSNLRYAIGKPDLRSKLLTEGKLVTRGILFDSGSSIIKPQSTGVLKEIAAVLNENANLKVKIIGHTDSDGDAAMNLKLSEERAMAIKTALVRDYDVNEDHLIAEGKGETQPSDSNTTAVGKANNRRVEFVKL